MQFKVLVYLERLRNLHSAIWGNGLFLANYLFPKTKHDTLHMFPLKLLLHFQASWNSLKHFDILNTAQQLRYSRYLGGHYIHHWWHWSEAPTILYRSNRHTWPCRGDYKGIHTFDRQRSTIKQRTHRRNPRLYWLKQSFSPLEKQSVRRQNTKPFS